MFIEGRAYLVEFWDHCLGKDESLRCSIVGFFIKETARDYVFTHWQCLDEEYKDIEFTTIIKSTLIKKRVLR